MLITTQVWYQENIRLRAIEREFLDTEVLVGEESLVVEREDTKIHLWRQRQGRI